MRILHVEDHEETAMAMGRLLASGGHCVTTASTLADARRLCDAEPFDLLICDLGLPDGDGCALGASARARRIPAIAVTGFGAAEEVARTRSAGFSTHLLKPVTFEAVEAAIAQVTPPVVRPRASRSTQFSTPGAAPVRRSVK
jgi:DNA-binding response OmpR family regulator